MTNQNSVGSHRNDHQQVSSIRSPLQSPNARAQKVHTPPLPTSDPPPASNSVQPNGNVVPRSFANNNHQRSSNKKSRHRCTLAASQLAEAAHELTLALAAAAANSQQSNAGSGDTWPRCKPHQLLSSVLPSYYKQNAKELEQIYSRQSQHKRAPLVADFENGTSGDSSQRKQPQQQQHLPLPQCYLTTPRNHVNKRSKQRKSLGVFLDIFPSALLSSTTASTTSTLTNATQSTAVDSLSSVGGGDTLNSLDQPTTHHHQHFDKSLKHRYSMIASHDQSPYLHQIPYQNQFQQQYSNTINPKSNVHSMQSYQQQQPQQSATLGRNRTKSPSSAGHHHVYSLYSPPQQPSVDSVYGYSSASTPNQQAANRNNDFYTRNNANFVAVGVPSSSQQSMAMNGAIASGGGCLTNNQQQLSNSPPPRYSPIYSSYNYGRSDPVKRSVEQQQQSSSSDAQFHISNSLSGAGNVDYSVVSAQDAHSMGKHYQHSSQKQQQHSRDLENNGRFESVPSGSFPQQHAYNTNAYPVSFVNDVYGSIAQRATIKQTSSFASATPSSAPIQATPRQPVLMRSAVTGEVGKADHNNLYETLSGVQNYHGLLSGNDSSPPSFNVKSRQSGNGNANRLSVNLGNSGGVLLPSRRDSLMLGSYGLTICADANSPSLRFVLICF